MTIKEFLQLTWEWLVAQYKKGELNDAIAEMQRVIKLTKEKAEQWWHWAKLLALICTVASVVLFLITATVGGFMHTGWPNALVGLLIALPLFVLLVWWTPLVAIIAVIGEITHTSLKTIPGAAITRAKWWLGLTGGILLWQVIASLAFTFIPYWNAPSSIPVMMLLALAMALIGLLWGNNHGHRKIIKALVIGAFVIQVVVCFIPQLATLATASTSRLGTNVQATAARVEKEGFFPAKITPPPPPRDLSWQRWEVKPTTNTVVRVYNGDKFFYKSPFAFKVLWENSPDQQFHNPSASLGEIRDFIFYDVPGEGQKIKILPVDGTNVFWLDFRIESRRTS